MPLPLRLPRSTKPESTAYSAVEIDPNKSDTDVSNSTRTVPGWPTGPQRISNAPLWIIADFLMLLMPIAFIALAAMAHRLDGKQLSEYGRHVEQIILLGPTLFPLAFAALGGRSLKKIALWKAERGTTLGFLEHMIGSQSLVATVGHAITLHSLNVLTIGLLLLWALSPLGGQSALRLMQETNSTITNTRPVFYVNVDAPSEFTSQSYNEDAVNRVNAVVSTSLMTIDQTERSPVDAWNHPKIPRILDLEKSSENNSTDRPWYKVERNNDTSYASLTGVDVINLAADGSTNFTFPYEYMYLNCGLSPHNNFSSDSKSPFFVTPNYLTQIKYLKELAAANNLDDAQQFVPNGTSLAPKMGQALVSTRRSFFIYIKKDGLKTDSLLFGSNSVGLAYYLFECAMKSVMVEANILCEADTCVVDRLRRLDKPRSERLARSLPYDVVHDSHTASYFTRHMVEMGGQNSLFQPNPIDDFVNGNIPWRTPPDAPKNLNWTEYVRNPEKSVQMSQRLTKFINTYWDASRWPLAITRNDPFGTKSLNKTSGEPEAVLTMNKTEAIVSRQILVYRANTAWVATLVGCSCVLLLLGIFSLILSLQTTVPDVFDYVSSFTRDNPYIDAPAGGSGIDGAERARLLQRLPVQLGDVKAGAETGYIALRSIRGDNDAEAGKVRRERMYE